MSSSVFVRLAAVVALSLGSAAFAQQGAYTPEPMPPALGQSAHKKAVHKVAKKPSASAARKTGKKALRTPKKASGKAVSASRKLGALR